MRGLPVELLSLLPNTVSTLKFDILKNAIGISVRVMLSLFCLDIWIPLGIMGRNLGLSCG